MGMFDYLNVKVPLPDGHIPSEEYSFQTKDFVCFMDDYEITEGGRLIHRDYRSEIVPIEERPYYGDEDFEGTLKKIAGSIKRVDLGVTDLNYHGDIEFHDIIDGCYTSYIARFTHGDLEHIKLLKKDKLA